MSDRIADTPIHERPELAEDLVRKGIFALEHNVRVFMMNGVRMIMTEEPEGWHLSVSRADRDPTWDEIATARYRLLPADLTFAILLPPLAEYVNLHPYTHHLWENPPRQVSEGELLTTIRVREWLDMNTELVKARTLLGCVQREIEAGRGVSEETATAVDKALETK